MLRLLLKSSASYSRVCNRSLQTGSAWVCVWPERSAEKFLHAEQQLPATSCTTFLLISVQQSSFRACIIHTCQSHNFKLHAELTEDRKHFLQANPGCTGCMSVTPCLRHIFVPLFARLQVTPEAFQQYRIFQCLISCPPHVLCTA